MEQSLKNYYYLKNNQKITQYISNIIESLVKTRQNQILLPTPIFIREDNSSFITLFSQPKSPFLYLLFISLANYNENKIKEVKIEFKREKNFSLGEVILSFDKRHMIFLNEDKNKAFILLNFVDEIILNNNDSIELKDNNYFEIDKGKILEIKFNKIEDIDDIVLYAIYCDNNILSIFNNKYINKEFSIFLNTPLTDFQIVKKAKNQYDLFILDISGNFRYIKNIQDIKNIPKSDDNKLMLKIDIYDKIPKNINNTDIENMYKKCYIQNIALENNSNNNNDIIFVIRTTKNSFEVGILINEKIYIIKKYNFEINEKENIDEIIPINNELGKNLIKTDKNIYLLDLPSLSSLFLPLFSDKNTQNKKEDILLIINEILKRINLSLILKLPSKLDKKNFAINYNFYNNNLLCIKYKFPSIIIKVYEFEIESIKNESNINKNLNLEDINNKSDDVKKLMQNLLASIEKGKELFLKNEIENNKKEEYYNKVLEEINSNMEIINNDNNNISSNFNESIELMKEWYINAYTNIKLYGDLVKNKYNTITNTIEKNESLFDQINKDEEIVNNLKKNIENKFKLINQNEKEITELKRKNNKLINDFYLINSNNVKSEKNFANELIKRINNSILKNIQCLENNLIKHDVLLSEINFEQMKNFPLTMKYLDDYQKEKAKSLIDSINNLMNTLKNFDGRIKEKEK